MNDVWWKSPTLWASAGATAAAGLIFVLTPEQVGQADQVAGNVGIVAGLILALVTAFRATIAKRR